MLAPFMTDVKPDTKVATAVNLTIGVAIGSLISGVARSAIRLRAKGAL